MDVLLFLLTRRVLPEHSVIPRGYSLYFWRRKDRDDNLQRSLSARPVIDLNADLEKADEAAKDDGATLDDCPFKSASSPDESDDDSNEVTIRVQGEVIDRIHLQPGYEGPATPPGLTLHKSSRSPQYPGCMEEVALASSHDMRVPSPHGESGAFASDLPPLPPSAYTAYGSPAPASARFVGSPIRSGATTRFADEAAASARSPRAQQEFTAESMPNSARSPRHEQHFSIPEPDRGPFCEEEIVRHFDELPAATPLRSAFLSDPRAASPLRSAREIYESRVPTPIQNAYTDTSIPPTSAAAPSSTNPYKVEPSPRVAPPEVHTADAGLSQYRCRSPLLSSYRGEPSPTDSTGYTESDSDDEPFPSARSPAYRQYLGTPRSATFPSQQGPPLSAHEVNPPMSARLPAPNNKGKWTGKWPRWGRA